MVKTNFSSSSLLKEGVRYLKVRTLIELFPLKNSKSLKKFLESKGITVTEVNRKEAEILRKKIFESASISDSEIDNTVKLVYQELFGSVNYDALKRSLKQVPNSPEYIEGWNGVYRDDIRAHVQQHFVRNPSITTIDDLVSRFKKEIPVLTGYTVMSWYNQWTSTIIEDIFMRHRKVIPTIRKIGEVDFFFLDVPIDLKVTFLPKEYTKKKKKEWNTKVDKDVVQRFLSDPLDLARWLYENQGENRFSDSHRLFIVLMNEDNLEESWKLKSDFELITKQVTTYLDNAKQLSKISWNFDGKGMYTTMSAIIPISEAM